MSLGGVGIRQIGGDYILSNVVFPPELTLYQLHFTSKDHTIKHEIHWVVFIRWKQVNALEMCDAALWKEWMDRGWAEGEGAP